MGKYETIILHHNNIHIEFGGKKEISLEKNSYSFPKKRLIIAYM